MPAITMPRLSDSMVDGTIVSWLRADGEEVAAGDELCEIETDKAIMPYQAEFSGPLTIVAPEGEVIAVGAVIGHIGPVEQEQEQMTVAPSAVRAGVSAGATASVAAVSHNGNGAGAVRVKASPVARRLAAALGVDLAMLTGSGPGGRIVKRDVQGAVPAGNVPEPALPAAALPAPGRGSVERRPLSATQVTIARRMVQAKTTAPEFTVTITADVEELIGLRARLAEIEPERRLSPGDFVIRACAIALREHPSVNAGYADGAIELFSRVNIGLAVAAPESLLVPTLYDADRKSLAQIGEETRALAQRARAGSLGPADMSNATFTVSNLGMYGVSHFTAVLNPPQAAILAVGAAEQQVVLRDGGFEAGHRLTLTLTADHRVIYGAAAAAFLASVRDCLENPLKLVL